ncbi:MAG: cytochrome P450 [Bacteroidia bacterium]|nr:cytochrome P450 [Bacteroidia bacterium]
MKAIEIEKRAVQGPKLIDFLTGSGDFPAFHFYELMKGYGDIVKCGPYFYLINHPDIARDILNRDQKDFSQEDFVSKRVHTVFGYGMVTSKGKLWSSQRRLLNPVFSHKELHKDIDKVLDQINDSFSEWKILAAKGDVVDLSDLVGTLAIMTAGQLLFNFDFTKYVDSFKSIVKMGTYYMAEGLPFFLPLWIPSPNHLKLKKVNRDVDSILEKIINEMDCEQPNRDSMGCVLKNALGTKSSSSYDRRVMFDEMRTMLAGGYFPVSCSLSMIWYALGENPEYLDKMTREVRQKPVDYKFTADFYKDFPVTSACIFEAMRLYPIAFSIWRKAKIEFHTQGYTIPKNKSVCISLFNIHRHPEFWDDPEEFKPERFMDTQSRKRPKHHYVPFGWGNRKCIGDHYAIMIIFLTIIRTLQQFDLKIIHEPLKVRRAALICPKRVLANLKHIQK